MNIFIVLSCFVIFTIGKEIRSEEIPGFFLKVTKNVPRLGRRSGNNFENYFRKASKNVPRIGRRNQLIESDISQESNSLWYDRYLNPSKRSSNSMEYFSYNLVQPMNSNTLIELLSRDLFPSDQLKFIPWRDFDEALQDDQELYKKLMSLGKDPIIELKDDLKKYVPLYNDLQNNDIFYYKTEPDNGKENV